ncbi:hypothetical protein SDC9_187561 [bioreactor metagenome]|uniref:Uncharacterized protein n=1 Tax=bioreactor metagenome TaxID=1076179 RepID=A0A645HN79_9ZZZZ
MVVSRFALAPNAATEAAIFPVDTVPIRWNPNSTACLSADAVPRSLKDHVGLTVSFFKKTLCTPNFLDKDGDERRGVIPSPKEKVSLQDLNGKKFLYRLKISDVSSAQISVEKNSSTSRGS